MRYINARYILPLFLLFISVSSFANISRLRCMWRDDPATTMVVGWDQLSGQHAVIHYDENDGGIDPAMYRFQQPPDRTLRSKGMNNHFVRLQYLKPNTMYYFIIADSDGCSQRYSFKTAPDNAYERLSIVAGGDSRNYRNARRNANKLVAKLNPDCVLFGGDMTGGDTAKEWLDWFDDWQYTVNENKQLIPIVVARGNHEYDNMSLFELFDAPNDKLYYALNLGGDLLRVYTLNSLISSGGDQRNWLAKDLEENGHMTWRFAQYHYAIRPHTRAKGEQNKQLENWAQLFYDYGVKLVMESDAHVVKLTHPLRPSRETGSEEGFIRDDLNGTTYIGEGCWGAPLRINNDDKSWTKASGSFNQFNWVFVSMNGVEVRTIKVDNADEVASIDPNNRFAMPAGLDLWAPNGESVLYLNRNDYAMVNPVRNTIVANKMSISEGIVEREKEGQIISWKTNNESDGGATFEVQRSVNNNDFTTFALISGQSNSVNNYRIKDDYVAKSGQELSYRVKHIPGKGETQYFSVRKVNELKPDWDSYQKLSPNPETGLIKVNYNLSEGGDVAISLLDKGSIELKRTFYKNQKSGNYLRSIDVSNLPEGNYLLIIKVGDKVVNHYRIEKEV
jgi:acid phosphatase type 7